MASADYQKHGLYLHNWYRKRHGSPKMELSERLNRAADAYAYKLACRRQLVHTSGLDYNENLYMSIGDRSKTKKQHVYAACEAWYNEKRYYSYSNPGFSMQTGHFTAMVWKNSTNLGIGYGESNGYAVVVACYKPHANGSFNFRTNVLPYREVEDTDDEKEEEKKKDGPFNKDMSTRDKRLDSFKNWPSSKSQIPSQFADSGFYYAIDKDKEDKVICFQCGKFLYNWAPDDNVWLEHERHSKECPFLATHKDNAKESIDAFNKYMTTPDKRLKTFENWPSTVKTQTPAQLVECGFYFTGKDDKVACYYCDLALWDFEDHENIWINHEKFSLSFHSKLCPFLEKNAEKLKEEKEKWENDKSRKSSTNTNTNAKKSTQDVDDDILNDKIKELFNSEMNEESTIGSLELQKILNQMFSMGAIKVQLDAITCSLLISLLTIRTGEKKRIDMDEFEGVLRSLKVMSDTAEKFDKDKSTTLDPFELKEALEHSGFHLGYKTFQTLKELFCKEEGGDAMGQDNFVLCFVLLSKLQIIREMSTSVDMFSDFSLKDWMQEQMEKANKN